MDGNQKRKPSRIKRKPTHALHMKPSGFTHTHAGKGIKTSQKTAQQMAKQAQHAKKAAKEAQKRSKQIADAAVRTTKKTVRMVIHLGKAAVKAVKGIAATIASGGWAAIILVIVILLIVVVGVCASVSLSNAETDLIGGGHAEVSAEVLQYTPVIQKYAQEYGIAEFVPVLQAVMMQESGGRGKDPLQASECGFNKKYLPRKPNAITDPEYSVQVGVQNFAEVLKQANCNSPYDTDTLYLSLQAYNMGSGYIPWDIPNPAHMPFRM